MKTLALLLTLFLAAPLWAEAPATKMEVASFGGGCFWCIEPFMEKLNGVESAVSGYQGGHVDNPKYKQITTGRTGHAEVVQVTFDPSKIAYRDLVKVFFDIHDPTTLNRQGADVGTQYRSVIFTYGEEQARIAREVKAELTAEKVFRDPIVTEISEAPTFYKAEEYHQDYFAKNPNAGYCRFVIAPKLKKIQLPENLLKD